MCPEAVELFVLYLFIFQTACISKKEHSVMSSFSFPKYADAWHLNVLISWFLPNNILISDCKGLIRVAEKSTAVCKRTIKDVSMRCLWLEQSCEWPGLSCWCLYVIIDLLLFRESFTCWSRNWASCFGPLFRSSCGTSTLWGRTPPTVTSWEQRSS